MALGCILTAGYKRDLSIEVMHKTGDCILFSWYSMLAVTRAPNRLPDLPYVHTVADHPVVSDCMLLIWGPQTFLLLLFSFLYVMLHYEWSVENGFPLDNFAVGDDSRLLWYGPKHITSWALSCTSPFNFVASLLAFLFIFFSWGTYFKYFPSWSFGSLRFLLVAFPLWFIPLPKWETCPLASFSTWLPPYFTSPAALLSGNAGLHEIQNKRNTSISSGKWIMNGR